MHARYLSVVIPYSIGALAIAATSVPARGVVLNQVDTFSSGLQNWATGAGGNPSVVAGGGPGGATDPFLQAHSDGSGSSGRLIEFNRSQWLGDYIAAGVTSIGMDLRNLGATSLSIRIAFKDATTPAANGYSSTVGFALPADGLWHHAIFGLSASDLTAINTPASLSTLLASPQEFRILHSAAPALNGDNIVATLGADNITALPAPGAGVLVGAGALGVFAAHRRRVVR